MYGSGAAFTRQGQVAGCLYFYQNLLLAWWKRRHSTCLSGVRVQYMPPHALIRKRCVSCLSFTEACFCSNTTFGVCAHFKDLHTFWFEYSPNVDLHDHAPPRYCLSSADADSTWLTQVDLSPSTAAPLSLLSAPFNALFCKHNNGVCVRVYVCVHVCVVSQVSFLTSALEQLLHSNLPLV